VNVLLTNDDGIYAPGIISLTDALKTLPDVDVVVVAPDRNQSGASHSLTLDVPMRIQKIAADRISVPGTPTDCVHLAYTGLLKSVPHMVVSGINHGANLGDDVLYSGTVAAAIEGRFLGFPVVAFSLVKLTESDTFTHFDVAAKLAKQLVQRIIDSPMPNSTILNVNIPDLPLEAIKGFEITRLGKRHIAEPSIPSKDPRGNSIYWVGKAGKEEDAGEGTDFYAVNSGKVSVTPLQIDLTHYRVFDELRGWLGELV